MGGISIGLGEELVETVLRERFGRPHGGDFNGQPAQSRATGEHQEGWNRLYAAPQVGESLTNEIASWKGLVVEGFSHTGIVSLPEKVVGGASIMARSDRPPSRIGLSKAAAPL